MKKIVLLLIVLWSFNDSSGQYSPQDSVIRVMFGDLNYSGTRVKQKLETWCAYAVIAMAKGWSQECEVVNAFFDEVIGMHFDEKDGCCVYPYLGLQRHCDVGLTMPQIVKLWGLFFDYGRGWWGLYDMRYTYSTEKNPRLGLIKNYYDPNKLHAIFCHYFCLRRSVLLDLDYYEMRYVDPIDGEIYMARAWTSEEERIKEITILY